MGRSLSLEHVLLFVVMSAQSIAKKSMREYLVFFMAVNGKLNCNFSVINKQVPFLNNDY